MPDLYHRITNILMTRLRALRLGFLFIRHHNLKLPKKLRLGGRTVPVLLPAERGIRVAFGELLLQDSYGVRKISVPVSTVLDIGGNVGLFALTARHAFPDATIHVYEPNSKLERFLAIQAQASGAKYFLEAVGLNDGRVNLQIDNQDSVKSRSTPIADGSFPMVSFKKALDRLGPVVDFAKIDCEGAEWELLEDTDSWARLRHLAMEYHLIDGNSRERLLSRLEELGFKITLHIPSDGFGVIQAHQTRPYR